MPQWRRRTAAERLPRAAQAVQALAAAWGPPAWSEDNRTCAQAQGRSAARCRNSRLPLASLPACRRNERENASMPMATREGKLPIEHARSGHWLEVLAVFLRLGLTSFGGPVAHLGYFRYEFVQRRRWLDERGYADLVAHCQFLPGPASSQVGIAVGLLRAGTLGALAAWTGFTLPSAAAMTVFGYGIEALGNAAGSGWLHGLKVAAVAVVAQAVLGMARALAPDRTRATLAVVAAIIALAVPSAFGQIGAI